MLRSFSWTVSVGGILLLTAGGGLPQSSATKPIDFSRDVRPVLSENCFACHGPDEKQRKADLRLDRKDAALGHGAVIVPGKPGASELIQRITDSDPTRRMPPAKSGKKLTAEQISQLRKWIEQGASWQEHWAFVRPSRPASPVVQNQRWVRNPIDRFILARHEKERLQPSSEALPATLLRRLSLDLIGLPPTVAELDAFLKDPPGEAFERAVNRLLDSEHFGERMALHWLDLARFGDSDGYHDDTPRAMWQFRDYVISSFNQNKSFDQFTIEQLAGDLLPSASLEEKVATAFHRCGPTSSEGGADAKEYLAKYAVDRVNTTASVWLGVTMQCAECHDHKYDPFSTKEYYQLFAFFNQVPEDALFRGNEAPPVIATPSEDQQRDLGRLDEQVTVIRSNLQTQLDANSLELDAAQKQWEERLVARKEDSLRLSPWHAVGPFLARDGGLPFDTTYPPETEIDLKASYENGKLRWGPRPQWQDGKTHYGLRGENCATYLYRTIHAEAAQAVTLFLGSDDELKVWVNDKLVSTARGIRIAGPNQDRVTVVLKAGENRILLKVVNLQGGYGFYFSTKESEKDQKLEELRRIAGISSDKRTDAERTALRRGYRERFAPQLTELQARLADLQIQRTALEKYIPKLRVMADVAERRPTHILVRGDFRKPGERVDPGVPSVLGAVPKSATRLDLAKWLVHPDHPLTARVTVNRLWQMIFGQGLVRTVDDFGTRGELPSHPELLDWLAVEFVERDWNVKHILRLMLTSATYRQSSSVSPQLLEKDPENVLLARGPRSRLSAELLRDNALAIAGLFDRDRQVGGPSVKPYQPGDLWREMSFGDSADKAYRQDHGRDLYRRGLYTFWKRSVLYPSFAIFDAPNREVCTARRPVTNTPLQAFVTLNDVTFVEAARVFAQRLLKDGQPSPDARIDLAYRTALARPATPREKRVLTELLGKLTAHYRSNLAAAEALIKTGESPRPLQLDPVEHAAWTALCQAILNLDECLTKE